MNNDIELGAKSIKFSYRSFLSDAAPGLALILIGFFSYYHPILGIPWKTFYNFTNLPSDVIIFVSILLFFLSIPLGLALNASSWILLGWLQVRLEKIMLSEGIWARWVNCTKDSLLCKDCKNFYFKNINDIKDKKLSDEQKKSFENYKNNWFQYSKWMEEVLSCYYPDEEECLGRYEGIVQFTRSIGLMLILILISNIIIYLLAWLKYANIEYQGGFLPYLIAILAFIIIFIINPGIAFYYDSYNLLIGYLVYRKKKDHTEKKAYPEKIDDIEDLMNLVDLLAKECDERQCNLR
jgi:hypothetical protein